MFGFKYASSVHSPSCAVIMLLLLPILFVQASGVVTNKGSMTLSVFYSTIGSNQG